MFTEQLLKDPKGNLLNLTLDYFDLILRVEIIIYQIKQYFFWISSMELLAFVVSTALLFSLREWETFALYIPHFIRCVAGFYIYNTMPRPDVMMK